MNDKNIKNLMAMALENREFFFEILGFFKPEDLKNGILSVPSFLLNHTLKETILPKVSPYVTDYDISFSGSMIFLTITANIKQLGPVKAFFMLSINTFIFEPNTHKISFNYKEDISSLGNAAQSMMIKAMGIGQGSYIQKLLAMSKCDIITATDDILTVDFDKSNKFTESMLNKLQLAFQSSNDEVLKLKFSIV